MTTALPKVLEDFFRAKNSHDVDAMLTTFHQDAVVWDEGEKAELRGKDEIRGWLEGTVAAYRLTVEVKGVAEDSDETVVTTLVSGDFPGSPIEFFYHVRLEEDLIAKMAIK